MLLETVLRHLETIAPVSLAEPWDNVGLIIGDPRAEIQRVLLAIDYTDHVAQEARSRSCELVVAYHPPWFEASKKLHASSRLYAAIRDGVALYSPHTALDVAAGGTNDVLGDILRLHNRTPVRITQKETGMGLGRVGDIDPIDRAQLIQSIKQSLAVQHVLVAGPTSGTVSRAAVGAGACGDLVRDVVRAGAQLYLTGEIRHHDALTAAQSGLTVIAALHSNSERVALKHLATRLLEAAPSLEVVQSTHDHDPFQIV